MSTLPLWIQPSLLGGSVLGHGLGAFGDGVLGELTWEEESDGGLDFSGRDGGLGVVLGQLGGFTGDSLEDVVDKRVHDEHTLGRDASVWVHLLQHLVDVDGVRLLSLLGTLGATGGGLGLACLLFAFLGCFWWHDERCVCELLRASAQNIHQNLHPKHNRNREAKSNTSSVGILDPKSNPSSVGILEPNRF
jgi:hypothetical protein